MKLSAVKVSQLFFIISFAGAIAVGTMLLRIPFCLPGESALSWVDAAFTATSAVCVTGLLTVQICDLTWLGQLIVLLLIQLGGLGVMALTASILVMLGGHLSYGGTLIMSTVTDRFSMQGLENLFRIVLKYTVICEGAGFMILFPLFWLADGFVWYQALWHALFHAVSAFCNAGFDLMGTNAPYSSLTAYAAHPMVNITIMLLIVIGGIGFLTWQDIYQNGVHIKRYRMQSKVILATTGILLLVPAVYFFFFEFSAEPMDRRLLLSLFQSVTPRTAGFNTADLTAFSETGQVLTIGLMLIGGSPGSTAGGMKTTTAAVLIACAVAVFRRRENGRYFGRRIADETVKNAVSVFLMYISLFLLGGMIISRAENLPILTSLFETASAIGTVGLTLGITPGLHLISKLILISLMFLGRVGGLTLIFAALSANKNTLSKLPLEKITVG